MEITLGALFTDATFRGGSPSGTSVRKGAAIPLVAKSRGWLVLDLGPCAGLSGSLTLRHVGRTALTGDFDGSSEQLAGFDLASLTVRQTLRGHAGLTLSFAVDNIFDRKYCTRAIEAAGGPYFTPAPPRTITAFLDYEF